MCLQPQILVYWGQKEIFELRNLLPKSVFFCFHLQILISRRTPALPRPDVILSVENARMGGSLGLLQLTAGDLILCVNEVSAIPLSSV